jgi:hypothetical protein
MHPALAAVAVRNRINPEQNGFCSRHMIHTVISAPSRAAEVFTVAARVFLVL